MPEMVWFRAVLGRRVAVVHRNPCACESCTAANVQIVSLGGRTPVEALSSDQAKQLRADKRTLMLGRCAK